MSDLEEKPYLSIIIPSRNDDHGGNMLQRMQVSLRGRLEQLEKHRMESELILVDWNPPTDKPSLRDVIKWPERLRYCTIRVIVVPPSVHQRYEHWDKTPMNVIVAINCGIRRARGQFILPGAIDLLYSDEFMSYIAARNLKDGERYRIDRYDVDRNVVQFDTLEEQLAYSKTNVIMVNSHTPPAPRRWWRRSNLPNLHTRACGDFQLMSRENWHLLRGYREADIPSAYADSLLSYASYAAGVTEVVLNEPLRLYHIDHDGKFNDAIQENRLPFENWLSPPFLPIRLKNKIMALYRMFLILTGYKFKSSEHGIPTLHCIEYLKIARDMVAGKRPYIFNDENWGLGQETLEEFVICSADWDKDYAKN
ncbi:hypothetical protein ACFLXD_01700 [Chloroflexota bacterium]